MAPAPIAGSQERGTTQAEDMAWHDLIQGGKQLSFLPMCLPVPAPVASCQQQPP